jgi:hypothetical protein
MLILMMIALPPQMSTFLNLNLVLRRIRLRHLVYTKHPVVYGKPPECSASSQILLLLMTTLFSILPSLSVLIWVLASCLVPLDMYVTSFLKPKIGCCRHSDLLMVVDTSCVTTAGLITLLQNAPKAARRGPLLHSSSHYLPKYGLSQL